MCQLEHWSFRTFRERIQSMLYERTAISKKPELTIQKDLELLKNEQKLNPDLVFRDPYFLDFLGLKDMYSEKDLETSIIAELQRFIIELGSDFAFLGRQKRITIDNRDYYIDLLFYHTRLKCYVVIELKNTKFIPEYAGKLNFYLSAVDSLIKSESDNPTIGILLCRDKNNFETEFALRDINKPMGVSEFQLTEILPDELKSSLPTIEEIEKELNTED